MDFVNNNDVTHFVALDDFILWNDDFDGLHSNQIHIDDRYGINTNDVRKAVAILNKEI